MPKPNDGPVEAFRKVSAATMRAVSHGPAVQVTFAPEGASLRGAEARLPMPSRDLPPNEVAIVRGESDAMALRLRHHDAEIHARRLPSGMMSRAIFEAVEQARCEALGSRQMSGVKANLAAALDEKCRVQGFSRIADRESAPLAEVVALLAREAMGGAVMPETARRMVDLWRPWIEARAGQDLTALERSLEDQESFADAARRLITDLDLGEDEAEASEADASETEGDQQDTGQEQGEGAEGAESTAESLASGESRATESSEGAEAAAEEADGEQEAGMGEDGPERPGRRWRPHGPFTNEPNEPS